jgi:hypothetical protein
MLQSRRIGRNQCSVPGFRNTKVTPSDAELIAYLEEMLPPARAVAVESLLRQQPELRERMGVLVRRRDQGGHSLGEIWRRHRVSCLSREQLGSYLLSAASSTLTTYIDFHLNEIGCRFCQANLDDLKTAQSASSKNHLIRRQKYFESSAGLLRSQRDI